MARSRIFISSVQKELAAERRALKEYLRMDVLAERHAKPTLPKQGMIGVLSTGRVRLV